MTPLIILNIAAWGLLLAYMLRFGAWAAVRGKSPRHGDPMRLGVAAVALVMLGFFLRRLIAPDSEIAFMSLAALSVLVAGYVARLARVYGRGPIL